MGKVLTVNLDRDTANYVIRLARARGVTPSEVIREKVYEFFHLPRGKGSGFPPRETYAVKGRVIFRVYLNDDVYAIVVNHLRSQGKSIASFIRELFAVVMNV
jgi:hypothetical protein